MTWLRHLTIDLPRPDWGFIATAAAVLYLALVLIGLVAFPDAHPLWGGVLVGGWVGIQFGYLLEGAVLTLVGLALIAYGLFWAAVPVLAVAGIDFARNWLLERWQDWHNDSDQEHWADWRDGPVHEEHTDLRDMVKELESERKETP